MLHLFIGFRWIVLRREKNGRIPFLPYMELDRSSAPAMSSHVTRQSLKDRCVTVSVTTCHPPGVQETAACNALEYGPRNLAITRSATFSLKEYNLDGKKKQSPHPRQPFLNKSFSKQISKSHHVSHSR